MPCFWELPPESNPGRQRGRPHALSPPFGNGQEGESNFIPLCDLCVWQGHHQLPWRDAALLQEAAPSPQVPKVFGGPFGGLVYKLVHACLKKEGWAASRGEANTSFS